jgi:hypothetical protein
MQRETEANMRSILSSAVLAGAVCVVLFAFPTVSRAQGLGWWGADAGRQGLPGAYVPYDGASINERYGYFTGPDFFSPLGPSWWYAYHMDVEDRAVHFGTRYGPDHPPLFNRLLDRKHR